MYEHVLLFFLSTFSALKEDWPGLMQLHNVDNPLPPPLQRYGMAWHGMVEICNACAENASLQPYRRVRCATFPVRQVFRSLSHGPPWRLDLNSVHRKKGLFCLGDIRLSVG